MEDKQAENLVEESTLDQGQEDKEIDNIDVKEDVEEIETDDSGQEETDTKLPEEGNTPEDEDLEVEVSIGEESPPQEEETKEAPEWVKDVRKSNRELKRQNRELQEKINAVSGAEVKPLELGIKPTLEGSDYDNEKFENDLSDWFERKRDVEVQQTKVKKDQEDQNNQWKAKLGTYEEAKKKLKVKDIDEAEYVAQESLSTTQQGMIIQGAEDPALVMYALGKNPKKLKEISDIKDPVKFAFTVSKLETKLRVSTKRRPESSPERTLKGNKGGVTSANGALNRLRDEAEKTGNYTKVMEYKNQLRSK